MKWSSKSLGSKWQHGCFYVLLRVGGWRLAYLLLYCVVFWYSLVPYARQRGLAYLKRRFPFAGAFSLWRHTFLLYLEFGKVLVDKTFAAMGGAYAAHANEVDRAQLLQLMAGKKGVILLTGHVGSWQMAFPALEKLGDTKVNIVKHFDPQDNDKQIFEFTEHARRLNVLRSDGGIETSLNMLYALQRGELLALMGDRALESKKNVTQVPFFGGNVSVPTMVYHLAAVTGAPIVVLFTRRTGPGQVELTTPRLIQPMQTSAKDYTAEATVFMNEVQAFCQQHPYQFFNFYDMWSL